MSSPARAMCVRPERVDLDSFGRKYHSLKVEKSLMENVIRPPSPWISTIADIHSRELVGIRVVQLALIENYFAKVVQNNHVSILTRSVFFCDSNPANKKAEPLFLEHKYIL